MKLALITDTHFGARNDSKQMQASQGQFLRNIFFPALQTYGVNEVVHLGDYGDRRKYINYNTARFIEEEYRQPLRAMGMHEIALVGNHDAYYRHSNSLNSITELYRKDDTLTIISEPCEYAFGDVSVLFLPWICEENYARSMDLIQHSSARVVMGHLELVSFQMYRGLVSKEGLDPHLFGRYELVMSGHYHHQSIADNIRYLGAPWPMVWSDFADPRGFHIFDTDTLALTFVSNPYSLFKRYVYDDGGKPPSYIKDLCTQVTNEAPDSYVKVVVKHKDQPFWFDTLIDTLSKCSPLDVQIIDDIVVDTDAVDAVMTADMDTRVLIHEYVQNTQVNCDKAQLLDYFDSIYREATHQRG